MAKYEPSFPKYFVLRGKTPVQCDMETWAQWFEGAFDNRIVEQRKIDDVLVSTVFLGIDHSFGLGGQRPILFETMIFGGEQDQYQERYATWDEAVAGHKTAVEMVLGSGRKSGRFSEIEIADNGDGTE